MKVEKKLIDAQFKHPFTCLINGPSGSGKTTFVKNLMEDGDLISTTFDKIYIFLGTPADQNKIFMSMQSNFPENKVEIIHLTKIYPNLKKSNFKKEITEVLENNNKKNLKSCIIFDDLMSEISDTDILVDMYSKLSTHTNTSIISLTQNLFHKGSGSSNVTIYRNTKILVVFESRNDTTVFRTLATKFATHEHPARQMMKFFSSVTAVYRYIVCRGNFDTPEEIKFSTDLFATFPERHFKAVQPVK